MTDTKRAPSSGGMLLRQKNPAPLDGAGILSYNDCRKAGCYRRDPALGNRAAVQFQVHGGILLILLE